VGQAQTTIAPDGRTLTYAEFGDLGGHPVISCHGTPGCRLLTGDAVAGDLEGYLHAIHVRLIRYDRPGYGGSPRRAGRSVAHSAEDIEAVADAVGVPRFAVEGGLGGEAHALAAAALLPERVERVALLGPVEPAADDADEATLLHRFTNEDAERREAAAEDDTEAAVFEATRPGVWGWVDDELARRRPWGFELVQVGTRTRIYGGGEWIARRLHNAELVSGEDWRELYSWLASG
jgi:pimeloyl-ACP methyl ester carboxylesterase